MNRVLPTLLFFVVVGLGAGLVYEYQQARDLREKLAQMERDTARAHAQSEREGGELRAAREQIESYKAATAQLEERHKVLVAGGGKNGLAGGDATDASPAKSGNFMKGLAKMYNDPKMKEMLRAQQIPVVQKIYGALGRELGLSPEENREVLALLADRQLDMASQGMKMLDKGDMGAKALDQSGQDTVKARQVYDEQLKSMLGPERYQSFQDYEKTLGERMAIDQLQTQLSTDGTPLDDGQSKGLFEIMKQERLRTPTTPFDPAQQGSPAQMKAMQSELALESWAKSQDEYNRRVAARARSMLTPDQALALEAAQKQQAQAQQLGMKMSREFIKGGE